MTGLSVAIRLVERLFSRFPQRFLPAALQRSRVRLHYLPVRSRDLKAPFRSPARTAGYQPPRQDQRFRTASLIRSTNFAADPFGCLLPGPVLPCGDPVRINVNNPLPATPFADPELSSADHFPLGFFVPSGLTHRPIPVLEAYRDEKPDLLSLPASRLIYWRIIVPGSLLSVRLSPSRFDPRRSLRSI
jgi:hypothetical protein